ncbi:hypothetical protein D3C84_1141750 [compost metagenome]
MGPQTSAASEVLTTLAMSRCIPYLYMSTVGSALASCVYVDNEAVTDKTKNRNLVMKVISGLMDVSSLLLRGL